MDDIYEKPELADKRLTVAGPIETQLEGQRDNLLRLDKTVSMLIERLSPILSPHYPSPGSVANEDVPSMAPLTNNLYSINEQLEEIIKTLQTTHDRVEL